jgi:integral membrane protein
MLKTALSRFRIISIIEGLSYLILLFIAMPIKYIADNPYPVKIVGMTHGILFIIFIIFLYEAMKKYNWNIRFTIELFIYSIIPFGLFFIERKIKKLALI